MSNRVTLSQLCKMDAKDVQSIPTDQLAMLQEDLAKMKDNAKALETKLFAECDRRFSARADEIRKASDKMTGTVRFDIDGSAIKADLPKNVKWDQAKMREGIAILNTWGEDPAEYVKTVLSVEEKAYDAWPKRLKAVFEPARTVGTGAAKYTIEIAEAA